MCHLKCTGKRVIKIGYQYVPVGSFKVSGANIDIIDIIILFDMVAESLDI